MDAFNFFTEPILVMESSAGVIVMFVTGVSSDVKPFITSRPFIFFNRYNASKHSDCVCFVKAAFALSRAVFIRLYELSVYLDFSDSAGALLISVFNSRIIDGTTCSSKAESLNFACLIQHISLYTL